MIFALQELIDMLIMIAFIGYIFSDLFKPARQLLDATAVSSGFDWHDFFFGCAVAAPAIVFHELAHKFVALGYGVEATFHAAYLWLLVGLVLKLLHVGFIFFVPGYVSYYATGLSSLNVSLIAFAGPFMNLVLWLGSWFLIKQRLVKKKKTLLLVHATKQINMFLFFFNMLPIPPFDGYQVFAGLLQHLF